MRADFPGAAIDFDGLLFDLKVHLQHFTDVRGLTNRADLRLGHAAEVHNPVAPHFRVAERFLGMVLEGFLEEQLVAADKQHAVLVVLKHRGLFQSNRFVENVNQRVVFRDNRDFLSSNDSRLRW